MKYAILPVTHFEQNCSILQCPETGNLAVIDPGGDIDRIVAALKEIGGKVEKILVTHGHLDHVGAVANLSEKLDLPIEGPHKEDSFWIDMLPQQSQMMGFPPAKVFTPTRWLEDGDSVTVGTTRLDVLHCPGHTPGHVVFIEPKSKLAIVGDVLFAGSIGRSDFPRGDHAQLVSSIREKLFPLGDEFAFIPGHGPMSTFGEERRTNPFVSDHRG